MLVFTTHLYDFQRRTCQIGAWPPPPTRPPRLCDVATFAYEQACIRSDSDSSDDSNSSPYLTNLTDAGQRSTEHRSHATHPWPELIRRRSMVQVHLGPPTS
jgi:hypothetical protein